MRHFQTLAALIVLAGTVPAPGHAQDKIIKIGVDLSLTGADGQRAHLQQDAIRMAFDAANQAGTVPGYRFELMILDDGTAAAGQYDPAQALINVHTMLSDQDVFAALGPQMSGAGRAMAPFLSQGDLATITPSSTDPDISDPKFAMQYRPAGKPIYFRTVTTDAYQGSTMADFFDRNLKVKSVFVLDDGGAFGVSVADAFQVRARTLSLEVVGSDRLDPKAADYTAILTRIRSLDPSAIFYGGVAQAGVKLAKQAYDLIPKAIKGGSDGMTSADLLTGAGSAAAEGWYIKSRFGVAPEDYTITAYDAAQVLIDAIRRVVASGHALTRASVRDAIQSAKVETLQGRIAFDANGDLTDHTMSVFKVTRDGPVYQGAIGQ
jgi:branched-chain amino acid transport system substrate-binding protein